jgi:hypothetical protein
MAMSTADDILFAPINPPVIGFIDRWGNLYDCQTGEWKYNDGYGRYTLFTAENYRCKFDTPGDDGEHSTA